MKKLLVSLLCLAILSVSFSQSQQDRAYYLKKSKQQKTTAWVFAAGGFVIGMTGLLMDEGPYKGEMDLIYLVTRRPHVNDGIKKILGAVGYTCMIASVPFFVASSKNHRKAMALNISFMNQRMIVPGQNGFACISQPSLNMKIGL